MKKDGAPKRRARRIFASSPSWTVSLKTLFLNGNFPSEHLLNVLMIKSQFWRRGLFSQYYSLPSPSCYLLRRGVGMPQPNFRTRFTKLSLRFSFGNINNFYCQIIAVPAFRSMKLINFLSMIIPIALRSRVLSLPLSTTRRADVFWTRSEKWLKYILMSFSLFQLWQ